MSGVIYTIKSDDNLAYRLRYNLEIQIIDAGCFRRSHPRGQRRDVGLEKIPDRTDELLTVGLGVFLREKLYAGSWMIGLNSSQREVGLSDRLFYHI